jgi:hypothetical protein
MIYITFIFLNLLTGIYNFAQNIYNDYETITMILQAEQIKLRS